MTHRTTQALQAAGIFCAASLTLYVLVNVVVGALPSLLHWFVPPMLASMFLMAFLIWWLVFRRPGLRLWHTIYAGFLISILWPLPAVLLFYAAGLAHPGLLNPETYTPVFLARAALVSVPFIILAALIRWRQVKGVVA